MCLWLCMSPLILTLLLSGRYYELHFTDEEIKVMEFFQVQMVYHTMVKKKKAQHPSFLPKKCLLFSTIPVQKLHN